MKKLIASATLATLVSTSASAHYVPTDVKYVITGILIGMEVCGYKPSAFSEEFVRENVNERGSDHLYEHIEPILSDALRQIEEVGEEEMCNAIYETGNDGELDLFKPRGYAL